MTGPNESADAPEPSTRVLQEIPRATVFIGSSTGGKEIARAIQVQLEDVADAEVWDEGVFGLSMGTLESLVQALDTFDFAVLVLTPDDLQVIGGEDRNAPRDNVLLELGLFIGRIGRARTFAVCARDPRLKLPSDLAGVTLALFAPPADPGKLVAALGPACFRIRNAIRAQHRRTGVQELQANLDDQQAQISKQQKQLARQQNLINQLVVFSMAFYIFRHLREIYHRKRNGGEYLYRTGGNFERELRYLRDGGYIEMFDLNALTDKRDLVPLIRLTPVGNFYVEVREEYERRSAVE